MHFTRFLPNIQNSLDNLLFQYPLILSIVNAINNHKGDAFLVGGAVRDLVLKLPVYDMDIEIHNLSIDQLINILSQFGPVSLVGKSFGVIKLHNMPVDFSLPRTDLSGRKPTVTIDPHLDIIEALKRRDLTMNAMAINLTTKELIDPFNGYKDILDKILRSPDAEFFTQDPLRFYRVMQFISRFEMHPDSTLNRVCKTMDIKNISRERIESEFDKLMLKSTRPSLGLRWLREIDRLKEILPELADTIEIPQQPEWHPEGSVFEHLMQSVDAAALLRYKNTQEKLIIMYAALCHDLGKAVTTKLINDKIRSPGHAEEGAPIAKQMLKRITHRIKLINSVYVLVKYHMQPTQFVKANASLAAYRRLALKLAPYNLTLETLTKLLIADKLGRNGHGHIPLNEHLPEVDKFIERAKAANVYTQCEKPILTGADILDIVDPGPDMGKILKYAYNIQLEKGIKEKNKLKELAIAKFRNFINNLN